MFNQGELICSVDGSNHLHTETPLHDMATKVRKRLEKHYEYHEDYFLDKNFDRPGKPLTLSQLDSFDDKVGRMVKKMTEDRELEKILGSPRPAGFCMGMTTLWLREVASFRLDRTLALKFTQIARPSKMQREAVGIQETYSSKLRKRIFTGIVTAKGQNDQTPDGFDLKSTHPSEEESVAAALKTDKKAGLDSELMTREEFPERKDAFTEQFHKHSEGIMQRPDVYRFSFQCNIGAHAMGLYSNGGRIFLMDPNLGVFRYVNSKHLDEDFADAFYNGDYKAGVGYNYFLFKLRKVAAA